MFLPNARNFREFDRNYPSYSSTLIHFLSLAVINESETGDTNELAVLVCNGLF